MKRPMLFLLTVAAGACASAARNSGPAVAVYEADARTPPNSRRMPEGCRLLATSGPVDQMESERAVDDPYKKQRLDTAAKGGNTLLVLSERTVTRPNIDCPSGDTSADCMSRSKNWFRLRFEQYACAPEAVRELAELGPDPHHGGITILLSSPKPPATPPLAPKELKEKLLEMTRAGVAPDVLLAYVKGQRLSRRMTSEDIIDWTKAGIPDAVIEAAAAR